MWRRGGCDLGGRQDGRGVAAGGAVALVAVMVVLIALHTPIAFAVGIACVVYIVLRGDIPLIVVPHRMISGMDSFLLLALPLFVLAGELMNTGGITERLVGFARALVGHIRGGLGMTTVVSEYLFSGISGSSAADVSAVGSLLIPSMTRAGYRPELAVSIVAAASAMGVLVPPCLMMVVLASLTDLSIAALFMAGFLPAAAMAVLLLGLIYVQARRQNLPREPRPSGRSWFARVPARGSAADLPGHHSRGNPGRRRHAYGGGGPGSRLCARARDGDLPRDSPARSHADPDQHRLAYRHGDAARGHRLGAVVDLRVAGRAQADRRGSDRLLLRTRC